MPFPISRRLLITSMLASVAFPPGVWAQSGLVPLPDLSGCFPDRPTDVRASLSLTGDRLIHVLIEETAIREDPPEPVSLGAPITLSPDPRDRRGGAGLLGEVAGHFSAAKHIAAPQLFWTEPEVIAGSALMLFTPNALSAGTTGVAADTPANWRVRVGDESVAVDQVFRKTVPINTTRLENGDYVSRKRHLVTLHLADPVASGNIVAVSAEGLPEVALDTAAPGVSELIHVSLAGYAAKGPKCGYVGLWLGVNAGGEALSTDENLSAQTAWALRNLATGKDVATGTLTLAKAADDPHQEGVNFNGCSIWEADFSAVAELGTYQLRVDGIGASPVFDIAVDPYADIFRAAARWYFHQRSGCAIDGIHGEGRIRPRNGHPEDGLVVWQSAVRLGRTSEGFADAPYAPDAVSATPTGSDVGATLNLSAWGGWHDAGDWDRRIQHMDPVYTLAQIVENLVSARLLWANIPESGKPFAHPDVAARKSTDDRGDGATVLPDLIHEALWGISLWRRTQGADGSIIGGVEYSLDGIEGSVSWNPIQNAYAYAPEEWAAYRFAMAAAKLGHVIATTCGDAVLGSALIDEATRAWDWAEANQDTAELEADEGIRHQIMRARANASGPLYRATGRDDFRQLFEDQNSFKSRTEPEFTPTSRLSIIGPSLDYVRAGEEGRDIDPEIVGAIKDWAESRYDAVKRMGADYGLHSSDAYPFGVGWLRFGPGSNWRASLLTLAIGSESADLSDMYLKAVQGMWFGLGCNPSNVSFVQGFGSRCFGDPLAKDLSRQCPVPGQLSFGVAGGKLRDFETAKTTGAIYPEDDESWPVYARIFESSSVPICAEFGVRSNAMEWLNAGAVVAEFKRLIDAG